MEGKKDNNLVISGIGIMARLVITKEFWGISERFKLSQFKNLGDYLIYRKALKELRKEEKQKERQKVKSIFKK